MAVLFTQPGEWLQEIDADLSHGQVDPMIVRLAVQFKPTSFLQLLHVHVIGTYLSRGHVVILDHYCGQALCGRVEKTEEGDQANKLVERLTKLLQDKGMEVRSGMYQANGESLPVTCLKGP